MFLIQNPSVLCSSILSMFTAFSLSILGVGFSSSYALRVVENLMGGNNQTSEGAYGVCAALVCH